MRGCRDRTLRSAGGRGQGAESGDSLVGELSPGCLAREVEQNSAPGPGQSRWNGEQAQPQAFGFPAPCGVSVQGEHLHPCGDLHREGDDRAPDLVLSEVEQRERAQPGVLGCDLQR